jgi:hypothetical protein
LYIDRGYINSPVVGAVQEQRGEVLCKPWAARNGDLLPKSAFKLDMRSRTIACPGGQQLPFELGTSTKRRMRRGRVTCSVPLTGAGARARLAAPPPSRQEERDWAASLT